MSPIEMSRSPERTQESLVLYGGDRAIEIFLCRLLQKLILFKIPLAACPVDNEPD